MPVITEELWTGLGDRTDYPLITAKWPEPKTERDADASDSVDWPIKLITDIRSARSELNIAPSAKTEIVVHNDHRIEGLQVKSAPRLDIEHSMSVWSKVLLRIARISSLHFALSGPAFDHERDDDIGKPSG